MTKYVLSIITYFFFILSLSVLGCKTNLSDRKSSNLSYSTDRFGAKIFLDLVSSRHQLYQFMVCPPRQFQGCYNPFKLTSTHGDGPYFRVYSLKSFKHPGYIFDIYKVQNHILESYKQQYLISQHDKYYRRVYDLDLNAISQIENDQHRIALMIKMLIEIDNLTYFEILRISYESSY